MFYSFYHFLHQQNSNTPSTLPPSNMRPDSNDLSQGWLAIPFNGGVSLNTTDEEPSPPAYTHTAADHCTTPKYDSETSPVASAAAFRRSGGSPSSSSSSLSGYALPCSLPSNIEMQDLGGANGAGGSATNTPQMSAPSATARGGLPAPVTQPKKYHGRAYRFSKMVLKIVGQGILIVGLSAAAVGVTWCIWRFIYWIAYKR
jgi:hypothetical protein